MKLKQLLKSRLKSQNAKILISNFSSLLCLQLANYALPFITLPYLARVLGVDMFGILAFAMAIVTYFAAFVDYGFDYTAVRDIARKKEDLQYVSERFSIVIWTRILLMILSFLILLVLTYTVPSFVQNRAIIILTFLYIPGRILFPEWFFQAMEQMQFITFLNFLAKLIFCISIFFLIKSPEDFYFQPILSAAGYIFSGILSFFIIIKKYKIKILLPDLFKIWSNILSGWDLFLSIFIPNIYSNFSIILLRYFGGDYMVGIYNGGIRLISVSKLITQVLSRTFFPFLSRKLDRHTEYVIMSLSLAIFLCVTLFLGAGLWIRILLGNDFKDSVTVLRILSFLPILYSLCSVFGTEYLVLIKKEKLYRNIIFISSVLGLFLAWPLVKFYGYIGAACSVLTANFFMALMMTFFSLNYKKSGINHEVL